METAKKTWIAAGKPEEIKPGQPKVIDAGVLRIAIFRIEDSDKGLCALEDVCTHDDGPLAQGPQDGGVIECPRHGAKFDIRTGEVLSMPAIYPIRTFPVRVQNGRVEVEVPE